MCTWPVCQGKEPTTPYIGDMGYKDLHINTYLSSVTLWIFLDIYSKNRSRTTQNILFVFVNMDTVFIQIEAPSLFSWRRKIKYFFQLDVYQQLHFVTCYKYIWYKNFWMAKIQSKLYWSAGPVMCRSFDFSKRGTPQNLALAPGASIRINTVFVWIFIAKIEQHKNMLFVFLDDSKYMCCVNWTTKWDWFSQITQ